MSAIVRARATRPAIHVLCEAISWAIVNGHHICLDAYGVRCVSSLVDARWERDPHARGLDPIGAAILMHGSCKGDVAEAGAEVLGEPLPTVEGLADGVALRPRSSVWSRSITRAAYSRGYEMGANLRIAILARRCAEHGQYGFETRTCPRCGVVGRRLLGAGVVREES